MTVVTIKRLSHDLRGIAHANGTTWFVEGALPEESVRANVLLQRSQMVDAQAVEIVANPAPQRVAPACNYYGRCGGCAAQHIDHAAQVVFKQQVLLDQLQRLGCVTPAMVLPPLLAEPWGYRRRVRFACKWQADKRHLSLGLRERHSESIVDISHCAVLLPALQALIAPLRACLSAWSQPRQLGHVELLAGDNGVAVLFRLLLAPSVADEVLLQKFSQAQSTEAMPVNVFLQVGDVPSVQFFCGNETALFYTHTASGAVVSCVPGDFVQGNAMVNAQLIDAVLSALQVSEQDTVLEAFCGLGNFTFPMARRVKTIVGLDVSETMLARAKMQAASQSLDNILWRTSNLDKFSGDKMSLPSYNKLLLDPPRDGAQDFCRNVAVRDVERVVYVSCNPSTLARDAGILCGRGFVMESVRFVDMFPQTHHIEALAVFVPGVSAQKKKKVAVQKNSERRLRR